MKRILIWLALVSALASGLAISILSQPSPLIAQSPLPVLDLRDTSVSWTSIIYPSQFYWRDSDTIGWKLAEDKTGDRLVRAWKVDVRAGSCLTWQFVGSTPGALVELAKIDCVGGVVLEGGLYYFVPGSGSPPPSPTGTETPAGATSTATPAPLSPTSTRMPTPATTGTPIVIHYTPPAYFGSYTIYGQCDGRMPWAYITNIKRDTEGKIVFFDKVACATSKDLRYIQNFDAIATLDATLPLTTAWWLNPTPTRGN